MTKMMTDLRPGRKLVVDLTLTDWPWQQLVAGTSDKIRDLFVGPGIIKFHIEMSGHNPLFALV